MLPFLLCMFCDSTPHTTHDVSSFCAFYERKKRKKKKRRKKHVMGTTLSTTSSINFDGRKGLENGRRTFFASFTHTLVIALWGGRMEQT